jgi:tRNA nucleotidyltransferase (CCA-adding enzyme)
MKKQTYKLDIPIPANVKRIHNAFKRENVPLFLVGGAVRDALMGKSPKDYDLATSAVPSQVVAIANKHDLHTVPDLGNNHGVVVVDGEEIATFRADISSGKQDLNTFLKFLKTKDIKKYELFIRQLNMK